MQTDTITRMRGMLEDEAAEKLTTQKCSVKDENKRIAQNKRESEQRWKDDQESQNQAEVTFDNLKDLD